MTFEYFTVKTAMDSIDIEDIGNVCLTCSNDDGLEWYLNIETTLGWCYIRQYGPLKIDDTKAVNSFTFSYFEFEFAEKRLYKMIYDFLNNPKRNITIAEIISTDTFKNRLKEVEHVWGTS